jgi:C4-dicarboxylate-binding protein DctP
MPFPEVYTALQQGVVDGVDCEYIGCWGAKITEVVKHIIELNHALIIGTVSVSKKWYDKLPGDIQMAIKQAAFESQAPVREYGAKVISDMKNRWKNYGTDIYEPADLSPYIKAGKSIYPQFYKKVGKENIEWVEKVAEQIEYGDLFKLRR